MVFRRKAHHRRGGFRSYKSATRRSKGMFGGSIFGTSDTSMIQPDAMVYGAVRQYGANLIAPLMANVPLLGQYSDEVGMGLIDWLVAKNTSGFIQGIAKKGLVVENARIGESLVGSFGMSSTGNSGLASYNSGNSY